MTSRLTVISAELSAWTCQPFCCQRTFALIPSERPTFRWPFSSRPPRASGGCFQPPSASLKLLENKKPGVERRAKSRSDRDSARSSTDFYPVLVKNLTIGSTSGLRFLVPWKTLLRPDCDALAAQTTPEPSVSIPDFLCSSTPTPNYFLYPLWLSVQKPSAGSARIAKRA